MAVSMITARVDASRKQEAEEVLKRYGRTYSDIIRDLTDFLARTGELPQFERESIRLIEQEIKRKRLQELEAFANRSMPPLRDTRSDEELLEEARLNRFGV